MQRLWIPGPLPGLNDIIDAKGNRFRSGYDAYSSLKRKWGQTVALLARAQRFRRLEEGHFVYLFREPNRRRDPSNFVAGGVKIVEDALQEAELLPNDGWKQVLSIDPHWVPDPIRPGVSLFVTRSPVAATTEWWAEEDQKNAEKSK